MATEVCFLCFWFGFVWFYILVTFRDFFVTLVVALIFNRFIFWLFFECMRLQNQYCGKYVLLHFFRESVKTGKRFHFHWILCFLFKYFKEWVLSKPKGMNLRSSELELENNICFQFFSKNKLLIHNALFQ